MTKGELIQNLGTIAYSGSQKFLEEMQKGQNSSNLETLIGQVRTVSGLR